MSTISELEAIIDDVNDIVHKLIWSSDNNTVVLCLIGAVNMLDKAVHGLKQEPKSLWEVDDE